MPGYTTEEIQASVNKFLLGTVTTPRTSLGARDVLSARDDIYALLTTTLLLKPDSYFYVIWLAKNRLEALRRKQAAALSLILDPATVSSLGRRGKPVTSTSELTNAQAALLNLNAGLNSGQGVQTRNLGPEVTRFRTNIERFIRGQLQENVVEAGVPTETAGEIRETIFTSWADVKSRHEEMLVLSDAIREAITNLGSIKLPEKAVREVVTRLRTRLSEIQEALEADRSLATHRESMLELLTMRTLLTRVSSFRTPKQLLAPLTGDSTTLSGTGGTAPASLIGTISGGFNVPPGATLDFEAGSPVVVSSVPLSLYSNARITSRNLTFPLTMSATSELRLRVDGVLYPADATFGGAVYANIAAFVAAIQGYLTTNSIPASVVSASPNVLIRSDNENDASSIEMLVSTTAQINFLIDTGFDRIGVCTPVPAAAIVSDAIPYSGVRLSEQLTEHFAGGGVAEAGATINLSKVDGSISLTGGTLISAPVNLENAGVRAGDFFWADYGVSGVVREILSVQGVLFRVASAVPILGGVDYRIGPDLRGVPAGARATVSSLNTPLNSGPYRIVSGDIGLLTVDRAFASLGDAVDVVVRTSLLVAAAPGAEPADGITAWPSSGGATATGLPVSATQVRADFTELETVGSADFLARGVGVGDVVTLLTTPVATTHVTAAFMDALSVEPTPYFSGNVEYKVQSSRYLAWLGLVGEIDDFLSDVDFKAADFAITRIITGAAPGALLGSGGPVSAFSDAINNLSAIQDYVVPFERSVDNILRMLTEQGMDRAADLFTTLRIIEFFSMHPDGVSYSTHLIRTAADVTRQVAPVSRAAKSIIGSPEVRLRSRRLQSG